MLVEVLMETCRLLLVLGPVLAIACACGGGGGGGGQTTVTALPPAAITADNAAQAAGAAVMSTDSRSAGKTGAQSTSDTSPTGGGSILSAAKLSQMSIAALDERRAPSATSTKTVQCSSGAVTGNVDDADNSGNLTKGDAVNLTFNDCLDKNNNSTANGSVRAVVVAFQGNPVTNAVGSSITLDMTFTNLSLSETQGAVTKTQTVNGSLTFARKKSVSTANTSLSTNNLTIASSNDTVTLTNFTLEFSEDDTQKGYTLFGGGTVSSKKLNGSLTVEIPSNKTLVGTTPNPPDSGIIRITGKNSSLLVTGIGSGNVQLDTDSNNDGKIDNSQIIAWKDLP
jgi:hypothetical protein